MSERKRGLGRGLGALIPPAPAKAAGPGATPSPVDLLIPERRPDSTAPDSTTAGGAGPDVAGEVQVAPPPPFSPSSSAIPAWPSIPGGEPDERLTPVAGAQFAEIPVDAITPNPRQPRQVFDEDAMAELVYSVREIGLLQPVVVRPLADAGDSPRYELIMGERRLRAARMAGLASLPAIVRSTEDDALLRDALLENLHRAQLNPLEEAAAYDQLLQDFGCTHDELASRLGRSRPQISNTLRLLRLPPLVQRRVAAGVLSAGHARALLSLDDAAAQERLAQRIVAEGLSVRTVEEVVAVGSDPSHERRPRPKRPVAPKLAVLAERLSDRFETRVKVDLGRSKGRIVVEFGSLDDLERIVTLMAPDDDDQITGSDPDEIDLRANAESDG